MTTLVWIIGSRGLFGSHLRDRMVQNNARWVLWESERIAWDDNDIASALREQCHSFAAEVASKRCPWLIVWAAGRGTMSSTESEMAAETRMLTALLGAINGEAALGAHPGTFAFCSSAGALYAGNTEDRCTEEVTPVPTTAYGQAKLAQESLVRTWAGGAERTGVLLRISTLYGPGQAPGKRQGLIAHIARSVLRRTPVHIHVPLDTMRDYIHAADAAADTEALLGNVCGRGGTIVKIIASETPVAVAEILGTFRKLKRLLPPITVGKAVDGAMYPHRIVLRSAVYREARTPVRTNLLQGIAGVLEYERSAFARG